MNPPQMMAEERVAVMESRVQALEAELAAARAALTVTRTRVMADRREGVAGNEVLAVVKTAAPSPHRVLPLSSVVTCGEEQDDLPGILIQPLPLHDALRRKWALGAGLPSVGFAAAHRVESGRMLSGGGRLRLFGLLRDGSPWEKFIPLAELVRDGGYTIGREGEMADVVLEDSSVSRMHARLEISAQGLVVSDLNSTNGVYVNDNAVDYYSPQVPLTDGATLTLGEVPLRVELIVKSE
ncbi:MAG: FHA domain-containing protein [Akkermansia sp.]|nr:FHA domain-containing protein [Akkermansia sp.]